MADDRVFKQSALKRLKDTYRSGDLVLPPLQRHVMRTVTPGREDWRDDHMHPSEMVKPDWCLRRDYYRITGVPSDKVSSRNPSFTMENIWNEGHRIEAKYQDWLWEMGVLWGLWECQQGHRWTALAPDFCPTCSDRHLRYLEVHLQKTSHLVEGHADGAIHGLDSFGSGLLEVKSIGIAGLRFDAPRLHQRYLNGESLEDIWFTIQRPFGVHLKQGMLYLWLSWPRYEQIVFLYESKFHQRTKEFVVSYNRSLIQPILEQVERVAEGVRQHIPPDRPEWAGPEGKVCASCGYRRICWGLEGNGEQASDPATPVIVRRASPAARRRALRQTQA